MAWIIEPRGHDVALARGLAHQWALVAKEALPPVLELVAAVPSWLAAMIRARALAGADARATALLDGFDHELARVTGHAAPRWPARLRSSCAPARTTTLPLPLLDPSQHLVCTGALVRETPASVAAVSALLVAAWSEPPHGGLSADLRVRAIAIGLPEPFRSRWLLGSGLTPPDHAAPGEHRTAIALLRRAYPDATQPREVTLAIDATARPAAVLDVLLATATVRMCLRAAGDLEAVVPVLRAA